MSEEGVPIRPPAIAELEVDSLDRYPNTPQGFYERVAQKTTSSQITFPVRQSLMSGYFTRIAVSEFQLQWNTPNVNDYNNVFRVNYNGVTLTVTIYPDFYNLDQLVAELVQQFNTLFGAGTFAGSVVIAGDNRVARITTNTGLPWNFQAPNLGITNNRAAKFYETFGISGGNFGPQVVQFFGQAARLTYTSYIDVVSDRLAKFARVKDNMTRQYNGQTAVLARIYLTPPNTKEQYVGTKPFTITVDFTTPKYIRWSSEEYINDFDLSLYDQYGELLWCDPQGFPFFVTEYQFTLQASET